MITLKIRACTLAISDLAMPKCREVDSNIMAIYMAAARGFKKKLSKLPASLHIKVTNRYIPSLYVNGSAKRGLKAFLIACTVFTWLNAAATINPVTKIDAATIRGRRLLH